MKIPVKVKTRLQRQMLRDKDVTIKTMEEAYWFGCEFLGIDEKYFPSDYLGDLLSMLELLYIENHEFQYLEFQIFGGAIQIQKYYSNETYIDPRGGRMPAHHNESGFVSSAYIRDRVNKVQLVNEKGVAKAIMVKGEKWLHGYSLTCWNKDTSVSENIEFLAATACEAILREIKKDKFAIDQLRNGSFPIVYDQNSIKIVGTREYNAREPVIEYVNFAHDEKLKCREEMNWWSHL